MKDRKKLITLITAIIIAISSIFIYKGAIAPKLYDKYLNTGIKYLIDGQYEEAILAFDKAIKIEPKTTEARVYQAKAYIGNKEIDKSVEVLEEAQNIDIKNEDLLKEILEILKEIDSDIAYEFLDRFIEAVGKDNISQEINDILNLANEIPSAPVVDPAPGTYVVPISVKLKLDKLKLGHSYYYTLDGTEPNKDSNKYRGQIEITESTTIKLIGYNKNDESTDVIVLEYIIDKSVLEDIKDGIAEGQTLIKDTVVGSEIGNISKEDKNSLELIIKEAKDEIKSTVNYDEISKLKDEVENAIEEFKNNIIKPTDKSKLKSIINEAQKLHDNSTEGTKNGQYKLGSRKVLLESINKSKKIYDNKISKQNEIDNEVSSLQKSIDEFKRKKVSTLDPEKVIMGKYIIRDGYLATKFSRDGLYNGYTSMCYGKMEILSKNIQGNRIQYKYRLLDEYGYIYDTAHINVINENTINISFFEGDSYRRCKLLTAQEFQNAGGELSDLSGWK